jgi:hypothetical protein
MNKSPIRQLFLNFFLFLAFNPYHSILISTRTINQHIPEIDSGSIVCPPGVYVDAPDDCVPFGPSESLARIVTAGIPYPNLPLPAYSPDQSLNYIPYNYYKVNDKGTPLFASLEDAISNNPSQTLSPGTLYISYRDAVTTEKGLFFLTRSGDWIHADGARYTPPVFQGLLLSSQPPYPFGWVLAKVNSHAIPGTNTPETDHTWYRYNVVQIYNTQTVDSTTWNLIAPDEWLESRYISRVDPHTNPPEGISTNRWIEVNLFEQTLSVYQDNHLIFATLVSSGVNGLWTQPGIFHIYQKKDIEIMSNEEEANRPGYYYLEDVPWTMYFDEKRALHGAYWHNGFGYSRSHGCVNLSVGDSHWLYNWANLDEIVYVYDPSGQTPTDPSLFGTGAP